MGEYSEGSDACYEFLEEEVCPDGGWTILAKGQLGLAHTVLAQRMVQLALFH